MIRDDLVVLSDEQAITATANSTDVYDTGAEKPNIGNGTPIGVAWQVTTTFDTAAEDGTLSIKIANGAATSLGTTIATIPTIAEAALVAGLKGFIPLPPDFTPLRYIGMTYTVGGAGDFTAGKISASLVFREQYDIPGRVAPPDLI